MYVTGNGTGETLTTFSGVPLWSMTVTGAPDAADNGTWQISGGSNMYLVGDTMTFYGSFGSCTGCGSGANLAGYGNSSTALVTFTYANGIDYNTSGTGTGFYTNTPAQTTISVFFGAATSISESAGLLSLLGDTGSTTSQITGGTVTGSGGTGNSPYSFGATNESLDVTISATPEPASFFLLGSSLLALFLYASRRQTVQI
jgi:hypothetical protein